MSEGRQRRSPGWILAVMCGVQFMVTLDIAVVNVAIPSIQADLGLAQADLQWVIVTYGVTLGGFLLLGGRAADLVGRRRVLLGGLALFVGASLAAGLADGLWPLVVARAVQGIGAALAAPAALSTVVSTYEEGAARTKALGVFAAVSGSGASIGVIAGGALTDGPGWPWIFLINLPIGVVLIALVLRMIAPSIPSRRGSTDVLGAVTVTGGLMAVAYAINQSIGDGWGSTEVVAALVVGAALLAAFAAVERTVAAPLVPPAMVRRPTLVAAIAVAALVFGSFFATIFEATLFMQQGLGFSAIRTGVAWLAATASSLVVAGALAPRVVTRFGASRSLVLGQVVQALGLLVLARAPQDATYWSDLFPGYLCFGIGLGFSIMATQVAAFIGVDEAVAGLAGGMVETAREIGGALGTAIVATIAVARADDVLAGGGTPVAGLTAGFERGMLTAAGLSLLAAVAAAVLLRPAERRAGPPPDPTAPAPAPMTAAPVTTAPDTTSSSGTTPTTATTASTAPATTPMASDESGPV